MRTRFLTIYSEEDFNDQLNHPQTEQVVVDIHNSPMKLSEIGRLSLNSFSSSSTSDIENKEEKAFNFVSLLNDDYKKNVSVSRTLFGSQTEEEICKYFKEIIKNRKSIFFNKKNRKTSYDINETKNKIKFRDIVHFVIENNLNDFLCKNIQSLSVINICLISHIETIDMNVKNKFLLSILNEKKVQVKSTKDNFKIMQKQIIDHSDNKLTSIKVFDMCNMEKGLNVYPDLSQVIILFFSGQDENDCINTIKYYKNKSKYVIVVENDPIEDTISDYCRDNSIVYYDDPKDASKLLIDRVMFLKKSTCNTHSIHLIEESIDEELTTESNEDEFDCLQRGMSYTATHLTQEDSRHQLPGLKKRMSLDSSIILRKGNF